MAEQIVLSPILQVILDKLASPAIAWFNNTRDLADNIQKLQRFLPIVQDILEDVEEQQVLIDAAAQICLSDIKDVANDALYLLLDPPGRGFIYVKKVKKMVSQLETAVDKVLQLKFREATVHKEWERRRETSSFVEESEVYGRDGDRINIVNQLLSCEATQGGEVSCITIEGMTGIGKTTLAQLAYNDEKVTRHFDVKVWVFVLHCYDVKKILMAVVESVSKAKSYHDLSMDAIHSEVEHVLHDKRYLIVLDDVWIEEQDDWEKLGLLFRCGINGSKILITTQSRKVALMMDSLPFRYHLKGLSDDDCWYLFKRRAFQHGEEENHPALLPIGEQIVRRCGGVALAAKSLGSLLRFKREETEWLYVRDNELWNLDEGETGILPALRLSYSRLPPYLKRCFVFCSIFPRGYEIKKEKLIQMWMAEGLIESKMGSKLPEDIGNEYFDDLLWMSFLEEEKQYDNGLVSGYKMHDVIYNLARFVAKSEYTTLGCDFLTPRSFAKIRHTAVVSDFNSSLIPEELYEAKGLLTLLLFSGGNLAEIPVKLYSTFEYLSVLDLSGSGLAVLDRRVMLLKHLKYLDLSHTQIQRLPREIEELLCLQTLILFHCYNLRSLPNLAMMQKLRHLNNAGCGALTTMFPRSMLYDCELFRWNILFGQYELQSLPLFVVAVSHEMMFLGLLNLRGSLKITHLENVLGAEHARDAQLMRKDIGSLGLYWGSDDHCVNINPQEESVVSEFHKRKQTQSSRSSEGQEPILDASLGEEVLQHLQPPVNLKTLLIKGYPGFKFPQNTFPCFLNTIHLIGCKRSKHLPVLGNLQFLCSLSLQEMHGVTSIEKEFYGASTERPFLALKKLVLIDFPNLEEWSSPDAIEAFPNLSKLIINKCPQLIEMPTPLSIQHLELCDCKATLVHSFRDLNSLKTLVIERVQDLFDFPGAFPGNNLLLTSLQIKSCSQLSDLPKELENLTSLKSLTIQWCEDLSYLLFGFQNLTALESLEISDCPKLERLPNIRMGGLTNLRSLSIENCNNLTSLPWGLDYLSSLESLTIMYCPSLGTLPQGVGQLSALRSLSVISCEKLTSLPEGLQNINVLHSLEIRSCPGLQALPEWIEKLVSLRSLAILECQNITVLPEGIKCLTALQHLSIQDCPDLLRRCKPQSGEDWPKIAHIPFKRIGPPEQRHPSEAGSSSSA